MNLVSKTISVTKRFTFEACHNLVNYEGKCHKLHGHSYKLLVTVSTNELATESNIPTECMVLDFNLLKDIVKKNIVDKFDHSYLNDYFEQPTAEVMALYIFEQLEEVIPKNCTLQKVVLYETEDSYAEVSRKQ